MVRSLHSFIIVFCGRGGEGRGGYASKVNKQREYESIAAYYIGYTGLKIDNCVKFQIKLNIDNKQIKTYYRCIVLKQIMKINTKKTHTKNTKNG